MFDTIDLMLNHNIGSSNIGSIGSNGSSGSSFSVGFTGGSVAIGVSVSQRLLVSIIRGNWIDKKWDKKKYRTTRASSKLQ